MVFQERLPRLRRRLGPPVKNQIGHRSLGDIDSQFNQFTVNPGSIPKRFALGHLQNKVMDFKADRRPSCSFVSGLKSPKQLETRSMPPNDRFGFDNDQCLLPIGPKTGKQNPEKTVSAAELRPFDRPFHGGQLLAKRKVLQNDIKSLFESEKNG